MKKVKQIEIEGLKGIDHLCANIDGRHILVTGKNRAGKSTFLQSLLFGAGYKDQAPPVRDGYQEGKVHLWSTDNFEFESVRDLHKGIIKVSVKKPGEKLFDTRVSVVGGVVGEIVFDPFAFAELSKSEKGRKEQVEEVKTLLLQEEIDALNKAQRDIKANEESRLQTGKDRDKLKGKVDSSKVTHEDISAYTELVDVSDLMAKKKEADDHNTNRSDVERRSEDREDKISQLAKELAELKSKQIQAASWLKDNPEKPVEEINEKIKTSSHHNAMVQTVKEFLKDREELTKLQNSYGEDTALIESQREAYANAVRSLSLPIPELGFDDEQLFWKGRPVHPNVLSTSEIMHLGFMIRMAKAPNCEVVVIHRGESFDRESMNELIDEADNYGLQLFVEKVVSDQEELKIEFLIKQ